MSSHHDPDFGTISAHLTQDGDIEIHRDSAVSGLTVTPLGTVGVVVALDILKLSGQAGGGIIQSIADSLDGMADEGQMLSTESMRKLAQTLRNGIQLPTPAAIRANEMLDKLKRELAPQVKVRIPAPVGGNVVMFRRAV